MSIATYIKTIIKGDTNERTKLVQKNIVYSFLLRGVSIFISFMLVPVTIDYLNPVRYGIWLTLSSILVWVDYFDLGLANGLKNKLTEALARKDYKSATVYVSTSYALIGLIAFVFIGLLYVTLPFLNWDRILNAPLKYRDELSTIVMIVSMFFGLSFVFKLITIILYSLQRVATGNLLGTLGNLLSLILIYLLVATHQKESFLLVTIIFSAAPVVVYLIATFFLFRGPLHYMRPRISGVDFSYSRQLIGLGVQFFVIQLSCIVIFSSSNILISNLFSPGEVTSYNIAYKYFNIIIMVFQIFVAPLWPAYTDAYSKNDFLWIKNSTRKMLKLWGALSLGVVCMIVGANLFYNLWVGDKVSVPFSVTFFCGLYVILYTWSNVFIYVINGMGKIRLQMYYTIFGTLFTIPASIWLSHYFGVGGIVFGTIIGLMPGVIFAPWQYYKLVNRNARGLWFR